MLELGVSRQDFFANTFERTPCLWRQGMPHTRARWTDLDQALQCREPTDTDCQMFMDGRVLLDEFTLVRQSMNQSVREFNRLRLFTLLHQGATLVLNRFEQRSPLTRELCDEVARFTGIGTSANSYVSWTGNGTFGKHWDTHDVFIVQVIGRKSWKLWQPTLTLPLAQHTSKASGHTCPTQPHLECILEAGDVLYIPRGWWHEVMPINTGSWHVSVGVYTHTVTDYLVWLCNQLLPNLPEARRGTHASLPQATMHALLQQLTQAASDPLQWRQFHHAMQQRQVPSAPLSTALFMPDAGALPAERVLVSRATPHAIALERGELTTLGGVIKLDRVKHDVLSAVNSQDAVLLSDLTTQLKHYPAALLHDTVRQLAVLEVLALREIAP